MKYLLDTNVFIHGARGVGRIRERLRSTHPDELATSVVTLAELLYGALKSNQPDRKAQNWREVLAPYPIVEFSAACASVHARLRDALRTGPIGERDLLIASIAVSGNLIVVSHNQSEFSRVPGLATEDWF